MKNYINSKSPFIFQSAEIDKPAEGSLVEDSGYMLSDSRKVFV